LAHIIDEQPKVDDPAYNVFPVHGLPLIRTNHTHRYAKLRIPKRPNPTQPK
jgi:hypothetical protein